MYKTAFWILKHKEVQHMKQQLYSTKIILHLFFENTFLVMLEVKKY